MRITLKKILLVGIGLVSAIMFLMVLACNAGFQYHAMGEATWHAANGSILEVMGGTDGLNPVIMLDYTTAMFSGGSAIPFNDYAAGVRAVAGAFGYVHLVFVILSFAALIGGFFIKTVRGARKLIIPFLAISIVTGLIAALVILLTFGLITNAGITQNGYTFKFGEVSGGTAPIVFWVLGLVFFIAAIIVAGVVPEKVFVGAKEEEKK